MNVYPFYPKINEKRNGDYQIPSYQNVLAFSFVPKVQGMSNEMAWESRKVMNFKFQHLAKLLDVTPGSGKAQKVVEDYVINQERNVKQFTVSDKGTESEEFIDFEYRHLFALDKEEPF